MTGKTTCSPATLALSAEKLNQDTPVARTLNRYQDALGRASGYSIGSAPEAQATHTYSPTSGRLSTVTNGSDTFTYGYITNSGLVETVAKSGTPVLSVTNTYDPTRDVLATRTNSTGGTDPVSKFTYSVNNLGQRESVATTGSAFADASANWVWHYDALGQVESATAAAPANSRAYQYDAIGNRLFSEISNTQISNPPQAGTTAYAPNPLNQYNAVTTNGATINPTYDFDGNMITGPVPGAAGLTPGIHAPADAELTWDAENRLIKAVVGGASGTTVTCEYDHLSRLIARTEGSTTTRYLYDGWNRIAEYTGTTLKNTYLWGMDLSGTMQGAGGVGGLLATTHFPLPLGEGQGEGQSYYPAYDGHGNVSEYLASNGSVAAHFEYDPFGNTVVNTDTGNLFAYRFSTKPLDFVTGLYYYGYRYYDPLTGRWPSRDPIAESGGLNMYGFVGNSGIDEWDYLGQAWYDDIADYFKEIPAATRECYGDTAGDIILSLSIVPYEEIATGDINQIAAGILVSRIPGAKCGIKGAKKLGSAFKKSDGKCYQKVEVEVKTGKKKDPDKGGKCKNGTWKVGECGVNHNPDCKNIKSDWGYGNSANAAQQASLATIPKHCLDKGGSLHHCQRWVCKKRQWIRLSTGS